MTRSCSGRRSHRHPDSERDEIEGPQVSTRVADRIATGAAPTASPPGAAPTARSPWAPSPSS